MLLELVSNTPYLQAWCAGKERKRGIEREYSSFGEWGKEMKWRRGEMR